MSRTEIKASTPKTAPATDDELAFVRAVLRAERDAIEVVSKGLEPESLEAALTILERVAKAEGVVIVAGLGKSGIIGKKIAATLASLGVASHEVHPSEAMHGDLGRIRKKDCVIALSFSGETEEIVSLAAIVKQDDVPIIAMTGGCEMNALAKLADVNLSLGTITEATELALAPTCSTTATLALGDALALALARRRAFTADDFARHHPGGTLGGLLRPVTDVLRFRVGQNLPVVKESMPLAEALQLGESLGRRPGALLISDDTGRVVGIFTDADVRRLVIKDASKLSAPIGQVMTRSPRTLPDTALVRDAVRLVREHRQDEVPIVDAQGKPVGMLDVQDLIALRVVQDNDRGGNA